MRKNSKVTISIQKRKNYQYSIWIALGFILLMVIIIKIRSLGTPLERDEGEFAYMGQLILQGIPPYKIAYNMKFPGIYFIYAFFMSIFGQSVSGVHAGLLVSNIASIYFLFLLVRKLIGDYAAISATVSFAVLLISFSVYGFAAHATQFVIFCALAGTFILFKAVSDNKLKYYFLSGILLGFAPLMKQTGLFFPIFGWIFLSIILYIKRKSYLKEYSISLLLYSAGVIIPFSILCIILKMYGVFDKFWFWTIDYAMGFGNQVNLKDGLFNFMDTFGSLWHEFYFIWIIALSGFGVLFIHPRLKKDFRSLFILLFLIFSFLSICPGLLFRPHYFVTLLPAVSILFGLSIDYLWEMSKFNKRQILKYISCSLLIISITFGIISQYDYFFILSPTEIIKKAYNINPFPESVPIGEYIKANSNDGDKIAILGSEPQICFYANRHSATGHITTYALMENHKYNLLMQKEMISDIESAMPKYFIYVNISTSWLMHDYSENYIFNWVDPFLLKNKYQLKGIVDIFNDRTIYKWDSEVYNYEAKSPYHVLIFRRNG